MHYLFFFLAVIGCTNIIVEGSIFNKPRDFINTHFPAFFKELIGCWQCCGTWIGAFFGWALLYSDPVLNELLQHVYFTKTSIVVLSAFVGSCVAHYNALALQLIETFLVNWINKEFSEDETAG